MLNTYSVPGSVLVTKEPLLKKIDKGLALLKFKFHLGDIYDQETDKLTLQTENYQTIYKSRILTLNMEQLA